MRNKFFIISVLFFGLYFTPNTAFAQAIEDSIAVVESAVADSAAEIKSYENEEGYAVVEKSSIEFADATTDTASITLRTSTNDSLGKLLKQDAYKYAPVNEPVRKENNNSSGSNSSFLSSSTFTFLFWLIAIGFLVVVIVLYALDGNLKIFSRKKKYIHTAVEEDVFSQNIFDLNYAKLIQQAVGNGEYNKASRLGFLKILTILSNKKMIDYGIEKTNFDYQFQLIHTKYYQDFLLAANYYEYAWYSGITISHNQYNKIVEGYKNLEQQIN